MFSYRLSGVVLALGLALGINAAQASDFKKRQPPTLSLEAQAYTQVEPDTVTITLQLTSQSSEQDVVTRQLNETVSSVLEQLKKQDQVKVRTGSYFVRPQYDDKGKLTEWRGQAQLLLSSTQIKAASELAAQYQDQMPVANVQFSISKQLRSQTEDQLLADAADAFKQRAQSLAQALGYAGFEIKEINVGGQGAVYSTAPQFEMAALRTSAAPKSLPIHAGSEELHLSLNGSVYLLDKK